MDLKDFQKTCIEIVDDIDKKLRVNHDNNTTMIHLTEEVGEVARQINNPNIGRDKIDIKKLEEEIADVILLITKLANTNKIDIEKAVMNKIEELKNRYKL